MAKKSTIRSIRISEDMAELIDQQAGNTFTEKWENLVTRCVWEQQTAEENLAMYKQLIDQEREKLHLLREKRHRLDYAIQRIQNKLDQEFQSLRDL